MRSRVIPGSSPTIERRDSVSRLNSVDLPTLGRPTMAKTGAPSAVGREPRAFFDARARVGFCVDAFKMPFLWNILQDSIGLTRPPCHSSPFPHGASYPDMDHLQRIRCVLHHPN